MKKRLSVLFLILTLICSMVPPTMAAETKSTAWKTIYVSPTGSDTGDGSAGSPFGTLTRAQEEVRKYNKDMQGDIVVNLMPGRYEIMTNLDFSLEDSASNGHNIIWQSADTNNLATISGGKEVKGTWTKGENGIWSVKADNLKFAREMFVNDRIATRAKSSKKIYGGAYYNDNVKWTHRHYGERDTYYKGFYVDKSKMDLYENPEDIELHWIAKFRTALFHVDDIIEDPNNDNQVIVIMDREYWNEYNTGFNGSPQIAPAQGFVVENAYELLDEPGEFYFNKKTKMLSYIPREGEDLNNSEIIVPQGEQLLYVHGGNTENCVKNLCFENIRFAHTTSYEQEEGNIAGGQAEYHYANNTPWIMGRASVLMDYCDNVDFKSNIFYGLSTMALHMRTGTINCTVEGNVFADMGATALCVGTNSHDVIVEPKANANGLQDAAWRAASSSSYHYWPGSGYTYNALNLQRSDENSLETGSGWYSEPWAKEEGTLPWIMIELESAYDMDNIEFSFPGTSTDEERSSFDVLVSNDRDFKEYKTLKAYTSPAGLREKIDLEGNEKYRYIKFQKTVPGPFCLNGVWAWTPDRMAQGILGTPTKCLVANNVFKRVALEKQGSYPIWVNYSSEFEISHNYIDEAPYAGITIGWGWYSPNKTVHDNKVNYNRVNDVMLYMDDGAGIYVLGQQFGTEVNRNYISNTVMYGTGIYFDQGTSGASADSNVTVGVANFFNLNSQEVLNKKYVTNRIRNSYNVGSSAFRGFGIEDQSEHVKPDGITEVPFGGNTTSMDMELPHTFGLSDPSDEAARIMAEAGLEDEWTWIMSRVPQGDDSQKIFLKGPDASDCEILHSSSMKANPRGQYDERNAKEILEIGTFGNLPWQYSTESKLELEYWLNQMLNDRTRSDDYVDGHTYEAHNLQWAIRAANESVYHPLYEEMLTMCDELAENTKDYSAKDINEFKKTVEEIKATNPTERGDKAVAAVQLERAYTKLYSKSNKLEIVGADVRGGTTTIDTQNAVATIELPFGMEPADAKPTITTSLNAELAVPVSDLDFSKGSAKVPLRNIYDGSYRTWTVKLVKATEEGKAKVLSAKPDMWVAGSPNVTRTNIDGVLNIEPWFEPTMYRELADGSMSVNVNVPRADTADGIGIIFSAQSDDLLTTTYGKENTYYMAKMVDQTMTLYKVVDGVATAHITVNDIYYNYGSFNKIDISVKEEHELDRIIIKLDGETIVDTLVSDPIGEIGYFGILTKNMPVKVK